jgi:HEAT repeats
MNHHIVLCVLAVLCDAGFAGEPGPVEVPQQQAVDPLDSLLQTLMNPHLQYDEYCRVSRDVVSRGAEVVPLLVERLRIAPELMQLRILGTLSRMGSNCLSALPELRRLLQDGVPTVRAAAAQCLQTLGTAGRAALSDLDRSLDDPDEVTVGWAAQAVAVMDPDFVVARFENLLERLGTSAGNVDRLTLRTWYGLVHRKIKDEALARDLRHWILVVHFTGRDGFRVADFLGP